VAFLKNHAAAKGSPDVQLLFPRATILRVQDLWVPAQSRMCWVEKFIALSELTNPVMLGHAPDSISVPYCFENVTSMRVVMAWA